MKAMDIIGRSNIDLTAFMHSAEMTFDRHAEKIAANVLQSEYDAGLANLRQILENKMKTQFAEFSEQLSRLTTKTERRLTQFDLDLKKIEADTVWKI